jgi:hypothetical protein
MKLKNNYANKKVYNAARGAELRTPAGETMSSDLVIL